MVVVSCRSPNWCLALMQSESWGDCWYGSQALIGVSRMEEGGTQVTDVNICGVKISEICRESVAAVLHLGSSFSGKLCYCHLQSRSLGPRSFPSCGSNLPLLFFLVPRLSWCPLHCLSLNLPVSGWAVNVVGPPNGALKGWGRWSLTPLSLFSSWGFPLGTEQSWLRDGIMQKKDRLFFLPFLCSYS